MWLQVTGVHVCCAFSVMTTTPFYFKGDSQEDSVAVVLYKQPAGGVYQSSVCELFQPCAVPCSQLTSPGALGGLLHPLEPSHETSSMSSSLTLVFSKALHTCSILSGCIWAFQIASFFCARNLFISATKSCWRSVPSCRREWTSYSETWPIARRPLPLNGRAPPHAPSPQCRRLFDTVWPSRRSQKLNPTCEKVPYGSNQ